MRALPGVNVRQAGISLQRSHERVPSAISCGLAGGLRDDLPSGTVLIPRSVDVRDGERRDCDESMLEALCHAARRLGHEPVTEPMLTSRTLVVGDERGAMAKHGYAGVDMETGLIACQRLAAVRVILDTPQRELSPDWLNPATAMLRPWNWPQLFWLATTAPRYARLAAQIIAAALL